METVMSRPLWKLQPARAHNTETCRLPLQEAAVQRTWAERGGRGGEEGRGERRGAEGRLASGPPGWGHLVHRQLGDQQAASGSSQTPSDFLNHKWDAGVSQNTRKLRDSHFTGTYTFLHVSHTHKKKKQR